MEHLSHAWVVGVADPTRSTMTSTAAASASDADAAASGLPAGHIFVTGLQPILRQSGVSSIFITRSPCIKPTDGRVLPIVTEQPADMPPRVWAWLLALPFGGVVFSANGDLPLPATIADGDLDGDLYLICWDSLLVQTIQPRPLPAADAPEYPILLPADNPPIERGESWLTQVPSSLLVNFTLTPAQTLTLSLPSTSDRKLA